MVIFPALERNLEDQLIAFYRIQSTIDVNKSFFLLPKCSGKPKYFPTPPSFVMPIVALNWSLTSRGVLEEKVIDVFVLFIFCPKLAHNSGEYSLAHHNFVSLFCKKILYRRQTKGGLPLDLSCHSYPR